MPLLFLMMDNAGALTGPPQANRRLARRGSARRSAAGARRGQRLPWDILLITAAALILISAGRLHSFFPAVSALRPALLLSPIALAALILNQRGARRLGLLWGGALGLAIAFFFIWATIGAPFALYPGHAVRSLLNSFLRTGVVVLVVAAAVRDANDVVRLLKVYAVGAIAFSVLGAGGAFRAFGGGGYDPNDAAMLVVSALPLVLYFAIRARGLQKLLFGFGILACASAVVMSGSRGGYLALAAVVVFAFFGFSGIRAWVRLASVAALVAVIGFTANQDSWDRLWSINDPDDYNRHSYGGRIEVWKRGMGYMAENPLLGVGINNFSVAEGRHPLIMAEIERGQGMKYSVAHSIWVQAGADLGVPGLIALVLMFGLSVRLLWAPHRLAGGLRVRGDPEVKLLGEIGRPLVGVLLAMATAGSFISSTYVGMLWLPFGLVLGVEKLARMNSRRYAMSAAARGGGTPRPRRVRRRHGGARPYPAQGTGGPARPVTTTG